MQPVKLDDIAESLDVRMEDCELFYHKKTGKIIDMPVEYLSIAEEGEEDDFNGYAGWEQELINEVMDIVVENEADYIKLPAKHEIREYSIMEQFCCSIEDKELRDKLCSAISGRGAFRRFKDAIKQYGLEDSWYTYKHEALCEIARDWCTFNNIPIMD